MGRWGWKIPAPRKKGSFSSPPSSFFFAQCPSTCYNQNMKLQQLQARFADRGLKLVSITCDPQTDTPAVLTEYARMFNADQQHWHFLTGTDLN